METRKIQKVGGSTFTVSVPKEWARKQGLETGEAVRLYTHRDGSLIVRGRQTDGESLESVSVPVTERSVDAVERSIEAAYEAGYERITLVADDPFSDEQRRGARAVARRLVGTEVLDADAAAIVVRAMLDASAVSIHQSIDQTVSIVSAMQRTVIDGLTGDDAIASHVRDREPDVRRLVALIRRHYNRSLVTFEELDALGIDRVSLSQYTRTADRIEQIATTTVRLGDAVDDASLGESQQRAVAERVASLRSALEDATRLVLEETDVTGDQDRRVGDVDRVPVVSESAVATDGSDPSLARILDALRHIADHVRMIEQIGMQSTVHDGDPS